MDSPSILVSRLVKYQSENSAGGWFQDIDIWVREVFHSARVPPCARNF